MSQIYDPLEFIGKIELITITIVGSFVTWKFINALYENMYEPFIDVMIESNHCDEYYVRFGNKYIKIGQLVKDFIKWVIILIIIMIIYNVYLRYNKNGHLSKKLFHFH